MSDALKDSPKVRKIIQTGSGKVVVYDTASVKKLGFGDTSRLPFSIRMLLESALRNCDNYQVTVDDVKKLAGWTPQTAGQVEIAFKPARVVLQDFTGVPAIVDLAAMRSAMKRMGGDIHKINPLVPCDLVVDHSIQVDAFGTAKSMAENVKLEFERNQERYEFLKWGQKALKNFRVVPPATGIVHQVNLEYLATGVLTKKVGKETIVYPDSLVGTDSHTTMINGVGIVAWGVGGIEAEAVMLGEPIYMLMPEVIGFKLTGKLRDGVTATDLVLTVTQMLRKKGVVGKFVEFYGAGMDALSVPDRATIANMAPEYGATMGFFPVDKKTLDFYLNTGRPKKLVSLVEKCLKAQGLFYKSGAPEPVFNDKLELKLEDVQPSLAGPKRPQDRVNLTDLKATFAKSLTAPIAERGFGLKAEDVSRTGVVKNGTTSTIGHGAVAIAAITSCTNTSNPSVMIAAGLVAKKAVERGLTVPSFVKTSLAPGSQVVTEYLRASKLLPYLEKLHFNLVGYGCTTCIGNSGPLPEAVSKTVVESDLVVASVLSGNRNFEGRVNPHVKANFLASPPLVVAYAIAGTVDKDLTREPIGRDKKGKDVFLKDIWPTTKEVEAHVKKFVTVKSFKSRYKNVSAGTPEWKKVKTVASDLYAWNSKSTYIQEPPFFLDLKREPGTIQPVRNARVLASLGDSVTTDHISPAGNISGKSAAGKYLVEQGVDAKDFNSYGARRGNDRVMTRGTFANIRLRNLLIPGSEGSVTVHLPTKQQMSIYDASALYQKDGTPLVILAGKEYGTGSSRDWAAKGTALLGVKVVIAESFERIHRSNLVGMGILPLQYLEGQTRDTLGLKGDEIFSFEGLNDSIRPRQEITVTVASPDGGNKRQLKTIARIDTPVEVDYYRNGGILPTVLRKLLK